MKIHPDTPSNMNYYNYTVTAQLGSAKASRKFEASDDTDAHFKAMELVLDLAHEKTNEWALGKITLSDPLGNVVATMDEKGS